MRSDVSRAPLAQTDSASATSTARRAWLRAVLALSLGASGLGRSSKTCAATLAVGQPAPSLVLHTLDGRNISTADLLGKVIVLTFWATWCEPCRDELPLLSAYAARNADRGLQVLGFSLDGA
ncbi:MAG TPA: TlpA disulfide reductase family protein, partial [Paraburkholderia sp.]